jgi:hypothetical protein
VEFSLFAYALHIALGEEITSLNFDQSLMRKHLCRYFENKQLLPFPQKKKTARTTKLPCKRRMTEIHLYCTRLMLDTAGNMVQCDTCDKWYHVACEQLTVLPDSRIPWHCRKCTSKGL